MMGLRRVFPSSGCMRFVILRKKRRPRQGMYFAPPRVDSIKVTGFLRAMSAALGAYRQLGRSVESVCGSDGRLLTFSHSRLMRRVYMPHMFSRAGSVIFAGAELACRVRILRVPMQVFLDIAPESATSGIHMCHDLIALGKDAARIVHV